MSRSTERIRALALSLLLVAGCGGEASNGADPGAAGGARGATSGEGAAAVPTDSGPTRIAGLFFYGDVVEFESCGGEVMTIDGPVIADLVSMHQQMTPGMEPLEAIFVDLLGTVDRSGFEPTLDALELRRVAYEGGGCDGTDEPFFFRANGTEPFWSLEVAEQGVLWTTPETTRRMPHGGLYDGPQGEWMFDGLDAAGTPVLTVTFLQIPCVNQMSGAWFHLSAEVDHDGRAWSGCAFLSPEFES